VAFVLPNNKILGAHLQGVSIKIYHNWTNCASQQQSENAVGEKRSALEAPDTVDDDSCPPERNKEAGQRAESLSRLR